MRKALPESGLSWGEIQEHLTAAKKDDIDWRRGRISGLVYFAEDEVLQVAKDAYSMFFSENAVGLGAFPSLEQIEAEVIEMALEHFHAGENAAGSMSTGGTESIFLAVKAARDWARANLSIDGTPQIVLSHTAHPAFDKAAHLQGLKVRRVPKGTDFRADVEAIGKAISPDTFMIVGSAPAYPHGVVDPISALSDLALERGIWLHVDSCIGGYLARFVKKLGYPVPDFDFAVPGVTSISADIHKHGYAAKGASTILYRDAKYFEYQPYEFDDWDRGLYKTNTFVGTRSGGAIAAAWAVMNYLGEEGYLRLARKLMQTKQSLVDGINSISGLQTWGDPELSVFTYGSNEFDIFAVADGLAQMGWNANRLIDPPGIHLLLAPSHSMVAEEYLSDLNYVVEKEKSGELQREDGEVTY